MSDIYDKAVKFLTEHPEEIYDAWARVEDHVAGCLFGAVDKDPLNYKPRGACGCLTQVKSGRIRACNSELTNRIRSDDRIPNTGEHITVKHLPIFAEWQRVLDKELGREP